MAIPANFLEEVKARTGIADVVGRRVRLSKKGHEHSGLCPFHKEKTPSFTVNEGKGFYHCFGCGAHGSVFDFVMETEGLNFREAVEKLAGEAGLEVPRETPEDRAREEKRKTLYDVTEAAAGYFQKELYAAAGRDALEYLRRRGLDDKTISHFRIGFAPDRRDGMKTALGPKGISDDMLAGAGLVIVPEDKNREPYDRFRGRIMFPIADRRGRVVAFGGRILPQLENTASGQKVAKYLNSPETDLFHKGHMLYAMQHAQGSARAGEQLVVVEGYMDVIALHKAGFTGAVAPLGTALTEGQIMELWKVQPEPVLCFDGDSAGLRAMERAATRALALIRPGYGLRFATLPDGEDPDTLVAKHGAAAFSRVLEAASPLSETIWNIESARANMATPEGMAALQKNLEDHARAIADPTLRSHFLSGFRDRIWAEKSRNRGQGGRGADNRGQNRGFGQYQGQYQGQYRGKSRLARPGLSGVFAPGEGKNALKRAKISPLRMHEEAMIANLVSHPEIHDQVCERLGMLRFSTSDLDNLRQEALKTLAGEHDLDAGGVRDYLANSGYAEILDELLGSRRFVNASIVRQEATTGEALESWEEAYAKYRQSDLRTEILEATRQLAADIRSDKAQERLRILQTQENGAVTKNAK